MRRKYTLIVVTQEGQRCRAWRVKLSAPDALDEIPDSCCGELREAWEVVAVVRGWPKVPYLGDD